MIDRTLKGTARNITNGKVVATPLPPTPSTDVGGWEVPFGPREFVISGGTITPGLLVAPCVYRFDLYEDGKYVYSFPGPVPDDRSGDITLNEIYMSHEALGSAIFKSFMRKGDKVTDLVAGTSSDGDILTTDENGVVSWRTFDHEHDAATPTDPGFLSAADKTKLDGIASGATANASDEQLRDRATHTGTQAISTVIALQEALDAKLSLAGGILVGMLTLAADPTDPAHAATRRYVDAAIAALVASAPGTLDTLNELAVALGNDPNFATTLTSLIGTKLTKSANLSDLVDIAIARTNLGLGDSATRNIGTTSGTAAAGDDTRFMSSSERTKLAGIATGATANATDAQLRDRATHTGTQAISTVSGLQSALDAKLPYVGGILLGALTLAGDPTNPLHAATKQYVDAAVAALVASAPSTLDTLNELAAALGNDPAFATTMTSLIGTKLAKSSNLSDLADIPTARTNLGLGGAATKNVGTASGTVAAGDDARFLTSGDKTDLTDGGDSTLHYHAADRSRANHTGTQTASTISDFGTASQPGSAALVDATNITWSYTFETRNKTLTATSAVGNSRTVTINGLYDGASGVLVFKQDATGGRGLTIATASPALTLRVVNNGGGALTLSSGASEADVIAFQVVNGELWIAIGRRGS